MSSSRMLDEIYPVPPIPPGLTEAIQNERIVILVAAGASRIIGCAGWRQLADCLVNAAFNRRKIDFQEKEKILHEYTPRKTISIFQSILIGGCDIAHLNLTSWENRVN